MSDRELRKSTRDASERLKQRQEAKQLLKEIKIRRSAYSEAITEAENQISELQEAADTSLNKTLDWDFENSDSEDDEEIEPLQAAKSPESSVISQRDTQFRHPPSPRNWSTSVNKFFPDNCEVTPVIPAPTQSSGSVPHSLPSPRLNLETITEADSDEVFDQQIEASSDEVFDQQIGAPIGTLDQTRDPEGSSGDIVTAVDTHIDRVNQNSEMDADTYNGKLREIKSEVDKVDRKWQGYTKDDVHLCDQNVCHSQLHEIAVAEESCQDKIFEFIYELDENIAVDEDRIKSLRSMSDELRKRVKTNSNEVKARLTDLIKAAEEAKPMSAYEQQSIDLKKSEHEARKNEKTSKVKTKIDLCHKDANSLIAIMENATDVEEMSDQQIRMSILNDFKKWEDKVKELKKATEAITIDLADLELDVSDQELVDNLHEAYQKAEDEVTKRILSLTERDSKLGLYTLAPSKNKETICYPDVFCGRLGENVHKFIADFKLAIQADHVRSKDEVKTLIKYLDADAKTSIGEHTLKLEDAFDILKTTYGNPSLIWNYLKQNLSKSLGKSAYWGKQQSVERRNSITKLIDFLNEAKTLATEHEILKTEINSAATITHIFSVIPGDIKKDVTVKAKGTKTIDQHLQVIEEVLLDHREETLFRLAYDPHSTVTNETPLIKRKPSANVSVTPQGKHDCSKGFQCKEE